MDVSNKAGYLLKSKIHTYIMLAILFIAIIFLFIEYGLPGTIVTSVAVNVFDFILFFLLAAELLYSFIIYEKKRDYLKNSWFDVLFFFIFTLLFFISKYTLFTNSISGIKNLPAKLVILRNIFYVVKILGRFRKISYLIQNFIKNPAQTMLLSFAGIILFGALLLMLPFSVNPGYRIGLLSALFTSTSAVCVTGLIVVDTAAVFSVFGKTVIMLLIQMGGIGIMIFAFFTSFIFSGKGRMSYEDKMAASYMLDSSDMKNIELSIAGIIGTTFLIEGAGALFLAPVFRQSGLSAHMSLFYAVFHSVSAFCNAGFALFTDSLESFRRSIPMNAIICTLIVLGGIGFSTFMNGFRNAADNFKVFVLKKRLIITKVSLNTKVVLSATGILIVSGWLLFYGLEHGGELLQYDIATQHIMSIFQSITLRTAGFNTLDISGLRNSTYLMMIMFMFIGGASGSTAGGIKVNTVAVIFSYIGTLFTNRDRTVMLKQYIPRRTIIRAFVAFLFGVAIIFIGVLLLSITEKADIMKIIFEVTSAFGTVGLSAGITSTLSHAGKIIIICIMFVGRLGFLTVISAIASSKPDRAQYPEGQINIG